VATEHGADELQMEDLSRLSRLGAPLGIVLFVPWVPYGMRMRMGMGMGWDEVRYDLLVNVSWGVASC